MSGGLSNLMLTLGNSSAATDSLHVELTGVDGAGHPDLTGVIGSLDLGPAAVPTPGPAPVDLQFGNPRLTVGAQYAVVVSTADAAGYQICGAGSTDFYGGGQAWGTTDGGATGATWVAMRTLPHTCCRPRRLSAGYCLEGRFLDLAAGQPDNDPRYRGAVLSIFVRGKGITCDPPPPGYIQHGRTTDADNVGAGTYALYVPAA